MITPELQAPETFRKGLQDRTLSIAGNPRYITFEYPVLDL